MVNDEARQDLDRWKMRDIGRVLGFFTAYSELQTGMVTHHPEYDAASLCSPKSLSNPKLLKRQSLLSQEWKGAVVPTNRQLTLLTL